MTLSSNKETLAHGALVVVLFYATTSSVIAFHLSYYFPVWLSVAIFLATSALLLWQFKTGRLGMLALVLWLVFALPFIHLVEYLGFDFSGPKPSVMWGLATNAYTFDERIINLMSMIGAVGALGFALGASLSTNSLARKSTNRTDQFDRNGEFLSLPIWFVWIAVGVALSWLSAPQDTLFTAAYTQSKSILQGFDFSAAWMVSYVFLTFAMTDAILDPNVERRRIKLVSGIAAVAFVVIYLQLLRGDRESIPLVFGLILLYFYWARPVAGKARRRFPWRTLLAGAMVLVLVSVLFGTIRQSLVNVRNIDQFFGLLKESEQADMFAPSRFVSGTWSAVLLTPLSVAGDYINDTLPMKWGKDYSDLAASIPPGFVAQMFDYVRPVNAFSSPAWEMRFGIGGTHATVVPFMNFRMVGVAFVVAFWAFAITAFEKRALQKPSVPSLAFLCSMVMAAPHWLWYGEKSGINAVLIWLGLSALYQVSQKRFWMSERVSTRTQNHTAAAI